MRASDILPTKTLNFKKSVVNTTNLRESRGGPAQILGGGVGGGKIPETFLYQKNILFASGKLPLQFRRNS
ncbi:hypothetical protein A0128_03155 [Leptospira tipperaryensis]|uniref:Uncharacterized protein n=1 Tax=Leptospira tipperaryensis TaxID=2564040 RepID=A0A1D7UTK6_9LEPT|nr:hypothetical protein A0128_03155 [Leptospira tipperaryensis]